VGEKKTEHVKIRIIDYDTSQTAEYQPETVEACFPFKDTPTVTWLNVDGVHDVDLVGRLGEHFGLHPLVIEDIVDTSQRPKAETYDNLVFLIVKMLLFDAKAGEIVPEQVSLVLGSNFVLSFQEREGDVFDPVRERIKSGKGRIRRMGADYLLYALLDAVVDGYFSVLESFEEKVDALEDRLTRYPSPQIVGEIHDAKRSMIFLRKSVWPLREAISGMTRGESPLIGDETTVYLRNVYDHTIQVMDTIESFRDIVSGMLDTYLSSLSNRMNEVMKVLTIIATIFIPLTFIAGIYGMNFNPEKSPFNMPELNWYWGYPAAWGIMVVVAGVMVLYFKRKHWL